MARVTGPLMSITASGTFGKTLVFSIWKGRPYVRERVIPSNPKSAGQTGVRSMMSYLAQLWATLGGVAQATWDDLAETKAISAFNAFVGENLSRWQTNDAPTQSFPAAEANDTLDPDAVGDDGVILAAAGGAGKIDLSATPDTTANADAVAVAIFRGAAAPTPLSWSNCIRVMDVTPGAEWSYCDSPLDAGTYHYKIAYISDDGVISALSAADVNDAAT